MRNGILFLGALLISVVPCRAAGSSTITSYSSLFTDRREPQPIQKAVDDLAEDLRKVFGSWVQIVHDPNQAKPTTLWVSGEFSLPEGVQKPTGWERLNIHAVSNPWPGSPALHAVVSTGSDLRGTIYAIYQFSQKFLRVGPLYWWTDHPPLRRSEVSIPDGLSETEGPTFRYRGFFINDEDLLTGWRPGIPGEANISLETWDRVFEAILRLKGNMVIPGTWIFPHERQIEAAGERGPVLTQHHVNVLGLDTHRWPQDKPYSFTTAPKLLEAAWKRSISQYPPGLQIVWSVGHRGQNDHPFWLVDKNSPETSSGRAHGIQAAIKKETEILRQQHPDAQIVMNAWVEGAPFIRNGLLKVPPVVTLVWPDKGHGAIPDQGQVAAGQGVYCHTAVLDARSNHFTELVPLKTIWHALGRAAKAGTTEYLFVNTGNLRPALMATRAVMELAWKATPWVADQPDESTAYLRKWWREEIGAKAAEHREREPHVRFAPCGPEETDRLEE